jgi:hemoglobin-like flavoprotein
MDESTLQTFGQSLERCTAKPDFLDRFYEAFLASSPKVRAKFANTDFPKQKRALHASLNLMLRAAREEGSGPPVYLEDLARRHGAHDLAVGAEYYDLWLDSLLATVKACDPAYGPEIEQAWEKVMGVGISFLCSRYNDPSPG